MAAGSQESRNLMAAGTKKSWHWIIKRFLLPQFVSSLYYFLRFGAMISPRAEVELSSRIRFGSKCKIGSFTKIKVNEGPLIIGNRCGLAAGCWISTGSKGIELGDNFMCGPNVVLSSNNYALDRLDVPLEDQDRVSRGVRIGHNVWIGAGTVVLDGSVIGDNTVVVANSLINRRYPANTILQGNPAKVILKRAQRDK